ncbi:hypothetical protein ACWYXK_14205 [Janthinobacterium lividum]
METIKRIAIRWTAPAVGCALVTGGLINVGLQQGLKASDWAAWVQAVGSVIGIALAIYVPARQNTLQRRRESQREAEEISATLKGIKSEIQALQTNLEENVGDELRKISPGTPFKTEILIRENPFVVYNAVAPRIGTISDDALRSAIIETYTAGMSFILAITCNNDLIFKSDHAAVIGAKSNLKLEQDLHAEAEGRLARYSGHVLASYTRMNEKIHDLINRIG